MREFFTNMVLFVLFCIAFSALTSCGGTERNAGNVNTAKSPSTASSPATGNKSTNYPPLPSALAESQYEMPDGTKAKFSDLKGKVVLLNLWGTWCGPCREEMPHLEAMYQKHQDKGFEVIGLNIGDQSGGDESFELVKKFAGDMKINYPLARIDDAATHQFYLLSKKEVVPQTFLVDREGRLRGVFVGGGPRIIESMKQNVEKTVNE